MEFGVRIPVKFLGLEPKIEGQKGQIMPGEIVSITGVTEGKNELHTI